MTGAEHYTEAERLLNRGINCGFGPGDDHEQDAYLAAAQVHATLALAAAQTRAAEMAEPMGKASMHAILAGLDGNRDEIEALRQRLREFIAPQAGAR